MPADTIVCDPDVKAATPRAHLAFECTSTGPKVNIRTVKHKEDVKEKAHITSTLIAVVYLKEIVFENHHTAICHLTWKSRLV